MEDAASLSFASLTLPKSTDSSRSLSISTAAALAFTVSKAVAEAVASFSRKESMAEDHDGRSKIAEHGVVLLTHPDRNTQNNARNV